MAAIIRRRSSAIWTAFFRDKRGKLHCRSTQCTDRKLAQRIANEFEDGAKKKRTLRQLQRVLDQMHELVSGERVNRLTAREFVADWLETKRPTVKARTLDFYQASSAKFLSFLGPRADALLSEISKSDLVAYRNGLVKKLGPKTCNHHVKLVRMLFHGAKRDGLIYDDPSEFIEPVKRQHSATARDSRRPFTLEELQRLLTVADSEWRLLILFAVYSAARLGDLARLCWANLDLTGAQFIFRSGKTDRVMILPLPIPLLRHLQSLTIPTDPHTPIHPRAYKIVTRQGRSGSLSIQFAELLAKAGLRRKQSHHKAKDGEGRAARRASTPLSFHSLRHSTVSMLHAAGIPRATVQAYAGHSNPEVHRHYTHIGLENLRAAAAALPDLTLP
jgi:integrase